MVILIKKVCSEQQMGWVTSKDTSKDERQYFLREKDNKKKKKQQLRIEELQ